MKPFVYKSGNGLQRSRKEIQSIRIVQAGRMEYELNRLRLLRERRLALLVPAKECFSALEEAEEVLVKLYGDAAPKGALIKNLIAGMASAPAAGEKLSPAQL